MKQKRCASFHNLSRFSLYLLLHFVSQKDAAAIGAKKPMLVFFLSISKTQLFTCEAKIALSLFLNQTNRLR